MSHSDIWSPTYRPWDQFSIYSFLGKRKNWPVNWHFRYTDEMFIIYMRRWNTSKIGSVCVPLSFFWNEGKDKTREIQTYRFLESTAPGKRETVPHYTSRLIENFTVSVFIQLMFLVSRFMEILEIGNSCFSQKFTT